MAFLFPRTLPAVTTGRGTKATCAGAHFRGWETQRGSLVLSDITQHRHHVAGQPCFFRGGNAKFKDGNAKLCLQRTGWRAKAALPSIMKTTVTQISTSGAINQGGFQEFTSECKLWFPKCCLFCVLQFNWLPGS